MSGCEIAHYGVKGMKWGVRRNPSRAFVKASRKARKLDERVSTGERIRKEVHEDVVMRNAKLVKAQRRSDKGKGSQKKLDRLTIEAASREMDEALAKYAATAAKVERGKWQREMSAAFSKVRASDLSPEAREAGREYVDMLLKD